MELNFQAKKKEKLCVKLANDDEDDIAATKISGMFEVSYLPLIRIPSVRSCNVGLGLGLTIKTANVDSTKPPPAAAVNITRWLYIYKRERYRHTVTN